jgi:UDP-N-acetylglucosamine--N-acetylmuramyl-(pentapeptide) pyrophosphoryl-undecaprenol N-acetylglucosamine transferase
VSEKLRTLLVMAGGTGGHIFPALAVAKALQIRGWRVVWLGNPEGMEARLVPQHGIEMVWVKFAALRGKGLLRKLMLPLNLLRAFLQARKALQAIKPDVVLGMGGYITFPGGVMAKLAGVPLVIHEQNAVAGLANRALSTFATTTICGFPNVLPDAIWVGNPVRADIAALPSPVDRSAQIAGNENVRDRPVRLLVVGGSLGAQILNETIPLGVALMPAEKRPEIVHQAGEKQIVLLRENYAKAGVEASCEAFIQDMAKAYAWADVVICRSGALTVAELAVAGVASILVPFPHAVDDHQTINAGFLSEKGAAIRLPQGLLTPEKVAELLGTPIETWQLMAERAKACGKPDATSVVANLIEQEIHA